MKNKLIPDRNSHPSGAALESYALARLNGPGSEKLENHLLLCSACRDKLEKEDQVIQTIRWALRLKANGQSIDQPLVRKPPPCPVYLPLYSLEAAAGRFGEQQVEKNPEGLGEGSRASRSNN